MKKSLVEYRWHDWIPVTIKVWAKHYLTLPSRRYQVIVPGDPVTKQPCWMLGAQLDRALMHKLSEHGEHVLLLSIMTRQELLVSAQELTEKWLNFKRWQCAWFDHSVCSPLDGRNQAVVTFKQQLINVAQLWQQKNAEIFYCHCMAGRGRSFLFTMAWLMYHAEELGLSRQLTLPDWPNLQELAVFIKERRQIVFGLKYLEGEQLGFAGLLALDWLVERPITWWQARDPERLRMDLRCAGLALQATLESAFRSSSDLKHQQEAVTKLLKLTNAVNLSRNELEILLWTPPWHAAKLEVPRDAAEISNLKALAWQHLSSVARSNWQRWQWWWVTAS